VIPPFFPFLSFLPFLSSFFISLFYVYKKHPVTGLFSSPLSNYLPYNLPQKDRIIFVFCSSNSALGGQTTLFSGQFRQGEGGKEKKLGKWDCCKTKENQRTTKKQSKNNNNKLQQNKVKTTTTTKKLGKLLADS
jgi:hypothetical protein